MDHYRTLQVNRNAEPEVIDKAYHALCRKYHPDHAMPSDRARATRRMQRINASYEVLSDSGARARYDLTLSADGDAHGWERFLDDGLVGLFQDWLQARDGPQR